MRRFRTWCRDSTWADTPRKLRAGRADSVRRATVLFFNAGQQEQASSLLCDAVVYCESSEALRLLGLMPTRMDRTAISRRGPTFDGSTVQKTHYRLKRRDGVIG